MKLSVNSLCPCGSLIKYKKCCKVFHDEIKSPATALELMKSRFSAFAFFRSDYIIKTTDKNNSDFTLDTLSWENDIKLFCKNTNFNKLEILDFIDGEVESFVKFKAHLFQNKKDISFIEKSRFLKKNSIWLYVDGEFFDI
ncbi:YchJ family protein [Aliarcobacter trophiarum]|uniref:YchJ family protein n=1 Tax=Aliarcobacter trophiarum TaxID=708186 RepID=UPI00100B8883|nr:YchJ family metal-binding protein [Aliarcobacter trophiarum]RXI28580.1 hypothetical protein CRU89_01090 [Aliarcobacter trophiarum]